jgi:hypothetical protein
MNIVFVVESEEQLTSGVAWCEKFVRMGAESIDVVIPGMDRNALAEHAKRRIIEQIDSVGLHIEHVQQDSASILQSVDPKHGKTLLLVYQPNDDDLQQKLFQRTTIRTIWTRGTPRPKKDAGKVISALADHDITTNASERILGVTPTGVLCGHCDSAAGQLDATVQAALETSGLGDHDLVVSGVNEFDRNDIGYRVGLVGGIAASYARTRAHLSSALAGAAIAAALVPPLSTAGLQIAFGVWRLDDGQGIPVAGPLLLATINVLTIMIGSSWVLWARGMRSDPTSPLKNRWTLRTFAFLSLLALLTLIWIVQP